MHLIVVPSDEDGVRATVANAHRRYAAGVNARNRWTGHFWQGRYGSVVMDGAHLHSALAYVTLNPVLRARLVDRPEHWHWSSTHAHPAGRDDAITTVAPVLSRVGDFAAFLDGQFDDDAFDPIRQADLIGLVGSADFIAGLETKLGRPLAPGKRGRKPAVTE